LDRLDHLEAVAWAGKEQLSARGDVVHDLEQGRALVAAAAAAAAARNRHVGQVDAALGVRHVVDAVGDDTDDHATAIEPLDP
jgi:hypothetical protein